MNIPKMLEKYWIVDLRCMSETTKFNTDFGFPEAKNLIGLNPDKCNCGRTPHLDFDSIEWEKNMLIVVTATKCVMCTTFLGPDRFAIHFCENCTKPIEPRGKKFMYGSQFRNCEGKEVCEKCFNDSGCEEVISSIYDDQ